MYRAAVALHIYYYTYMNMPTNMACSCKVLKGSSGWLNKANWIYF